MGYGAGSFERKTKANKMITKYFCRLLAPRKNVDCDSNWGSYKFEMRKRYRKVGSTMDGKVPQNNYSIGHFVDNAHIFQRNRSASTSWMYNRTWL